MVRFVGMLADNVQRVKGALEGVYQLAIGGTAVGTGINSAPWFAEAAAAEIAEQVHGSRLSQRSCTSFRYVAHAGGFALQNWQ